jgi:hypothetical protein
MHLQHSTPMASRRTSSPVPRKAATQLRVLLERVERGELTAPGPMIAHLRGALATLEELAKRQRRRTKRVKV